jgi:periplasmic protein TonB
VMAPPPPKGFQVLTAPVKVPDVLPDIDLSKKVTDEADFSGKGVAGGTSKGVVGGTAPVNSDQPFFEFQVEKQVQQIPGSGNLRYPDMLRSANVEGEVLAQFVVDTSGKYEAGTFKVLKSSHDLFTAAVKNALPTMRFYPAEVGGRKVKQLVQQPFTFSLQKS